MAQPTGSFSLRRFFRRAKGVLSCRWGGVGKYIAMAYSEWALGIIDFKSLAFFAFDRVGVLLWVEQLGVEPGVDDFAALRLGLVWVVFLHHGPDLSLCCGGGGWLAGFGWVWWRRAHSS